MEKNTFFNRELSWLEFNGRVLFEAERTDTPLLERLKFLIIAASNFDEFFMVRVAGLKHEAKINPDFKDLAGMTAKTQLEKISERAHELTQKQYELLNKQILPELQKQGITYIPPEKYTLEQKIFLETIFQKEIFPLLTPLRLDGQTELPLISLRTHIAFLLSLIDSQTTTPPLQLENQENPLAVVQIPPKIPHVIFLPSDGKSKPFAVLHDIIREFGTLLFPGYKTQESLIFKVARGADFAVDEDREADFIQAMEEVLVNRQSSKPVRMTCSNHSQKIQTLLTQRLGLQEADVYKIDGFSDVTAFSDLLSLEGYDSLKNPVWKNYFSATLEHDKPLWDTLKQRDILLHVPYESYDPVVNFVSDAADDAQVLAIKMTLYRTGGDSPIVQALERAARNGKQVTAFVELKARFDEKQNISWAERLEKAGVIVVYGIANLKVHAKILLVVRREPEGIKRYVHLSTGNFNHKTARLYIDMSLFTANTEIASDATVFFNMISGYSAIHTMKRLVMAPINLKSTLIHLIEREIQHSTPEKPGLIMAKMNSLGHEEVIQALYRANDAGVRIMLNVRGVCMLVPNIKKQSEHIHVVSVIDRFLEHTRIFYFQNGGNEEVYLSSADWMPRNLDRRVELMFPVLQRDLFKEIKDTLNTYFADNTHAHYLQSNGSWIPRFKLETKNSFAEKKRRSQEELYEYYKKAAERKEKTLPKEFIVRRK